MTAGRRAYVRRGDGMAGLAKKAAGVAAANVLTRAMGFAIRILLSRMLGAEALGVSEMAHGAHMLAITPLTAGLPAAVSRETARGRGDGLPLAAGRQLARRFGWALAAAYLILTPLIARLLGDARTLPTLLVGAPCVIILGVSCVYNGHCYGIGRTTPPVASELIEQLLRLALAPVCLTLVSGRALSLRAAAPGVGTVIAELLSLIVIAVWLRGAAGRHDKRALADMRKTLMRTAAPLTLSRLTTTALRMLMGVMVPLRLVASGLSRSEAVAGYGMIGGMAMPLMLLPCMATGAMAVVGAPAFARMETRRRDVKRLLGRMLAFAAPLGAVSAVSVYLLADFAANAVYAQPALAPVLRALCPVALLMPLCQVTGTALTGLGLQTKSLRASVLGAFVTLIAVYFLAARSDMRLSGAAIAYIAGQATVFAAQMIAYLRFIRQENDR